MPRPLHRRDAALVMRTPITFSAITLASAVAAFLLNPILFPPNPSVAPPEPALIPYFLGIAVVETLFFGVGVAFVIMGLPMLRRVARVSGISAWPAYLAISYLTASWWPHLGMHAVAGLDMEKLIVVDYVFHLPYIISAVIVAHFFWRTLQASTTNTVRKPVMAARPASRAA
jgi:hypothetical protein